MSYRTTWWVVATLTASLALLLALIHAPARAMIVAGILPAALVWCARALLSNGGAAVRRNAAAAAGLACAGGLTALGLSMTYGWQGFAAALAVAAAHPDLVPILARVAPGGAADPLAARTRL